MVYNYEWFNNNSSSSNSNNNNMNDLDLIKSTPLGEWHKKHGARMVEYAGWEMPIQYTGIKDEHLYTRNEASTFDVSHMGEIRFKGEGALEALSHLIPTDITDLKEGKAQYSFFTNERGGVVDDLIIYCFKPSKDYLVCVNAANTDKAFAHAKRFTKDFDIEVFNESDQWAQVALQGPKALDICEKVFSGTKDLVPFGFFMSSFIDGGSFESNSCESNSRKFNSREFNDFKSNNCIVAYTGYTGEPGVEVFTPKSIAESVWNKFLSLGAKPCGLAARDSLRLEAALNLYGNELSEECNPFERRMGWTISKNKTGYVGQEALWALKDKATRTLKGLKSLDRAIPRAGYEVLSLEGQVIGEVTSGTLSPVLNYPIAMVWIDKKSVEREKKIQVNVKVKVKVRVRGNLVDSEIIPLPFINFIKKK